MLIFDPEDHRREFGGDMLKAWRTAHARLMEYLGEDTSGAVVVCGTPASGKTTWLGEGASALPLGTRAVFCAPLSTAKARSLVARQLHKPTLIHVHASLYDCLDRADSDTRERNQAHLRRCHSQLEAKPPTISEGWLCIRNV